MFFIWYNFPIFRDKLWDKSWDRYLILIFVIGCYLIDGIYEKVLLVHWVTMNFLNLYFFRYFISYTLSLFNLLLFIMIPVAQLYYIFYNSPWYFVLRNFILLSDLQNFIKLTPTLIFCWISETFGLFGLLITLLLL